MCIRDRKSLGKRSSSSWSQLSQLYANSGCKVPDKLPLLEYKDNRAIRCGVVIGSLRSQRDCAFLSALLADVYSSDQYWFEKFKGRFLSPKTRLIRYGPSLEVQDVGESKMVFTLPSPWLQSHGVELLESDQVNQTGDDGCHVYLGVNALNLSTSPWPSFSINDSDNSSPLGTREVNSALALAGVEKLINSKANASEYVRDMENSNFTNISKQLTQQICNREVVLQLLSGAVIKNIYETDTSLAKRSELLTEKAKLERKIEEWAFDAHSFTQSSLKPQLDGFVKRQLSVFRLLTYSESRLELKLRELCDRAIDSSISDRVQFIRGQLNIKLVPQKQAARDSCYLKVAQLHRTINKFIYQQFFKLQLPLIVCSFVGTLSGQFSAYSMGSLAALGIVCLLYTSRCV